MSDGVLHSVLMRDESGVIVEFQEKIYSPAVILAAAHSLSSKIVVHISSGDEIIRCALLPRAPLSEVGPDIFKEFLERVTDYSLRSRLEQATAPIRDLLLAQAFSRANLFHPELDSAKPSGGSP